MPEMLWDELSELNCQSLHLKVQTFIQITDSCVMSEMWVCVIIIIINGCLYIKQLLLIVSSGVVLFLILDFMHSPAVSSPWKQKLAIRFISNSKFLFLTNARGRITVYFLLISIQLWSAWSYYRFVYRNSTAEFQNSWYWTSCIPQLYPPHGNKNFLLDSYLIASFCFYGEDTAVECMKLLSFCLQQQYSRISVSNVIMW